ncbi:basic secretory protein-like protein [Aldersonia kunmingensis]|uniref:basic secretory protein-like protein n=1 Tax=Aldersonia kunmingensis TaxID=408066 RepID=UPI000B2B4A2A|nr:basic secretory protein-like protein [Aldersonia kunmingensis]
MPAGTERDPDQPTKRRGLEGRERTALVGLVVAFAAVLLVIALAVPESESGDSGAANSTAPAEPSDPYQQQRRAAVQDLLDRWATALRSGDAEALSELLDPNADAAFRTAELNRAASVSEVPLSDWGFEILDEPEIPVPPAAFAALDAADAWYAPVMLRYAVDGPDAQPTRKPVALTVARHGDDWYLVSDAPVAGRTTWRGPWDFGPVISRRVPGPDGRSSVVIGHPEQAIEVNALAGEVASAESAVTDVWGPAWSRSVLVEAAGDQAEFAALAGDSRDSDQVAAVTVADAVDLEHGTATGQRIVFSPAAVAGLTDTTRRSVLRHELTHVAARASTKDGSPMWVLEGFADYVGYRESGRGFAEIAPTLSGEIHAGTLPLALPQDADFTGERAVLAYEWAWSMNAFVADQYGEATLTELYRELSGGPAGPPEIDAALHNVLGVGTGEFLDRWHDWVTRQAR